MIHPTIWYDLLNVKEIYTRGRIIKIENGRKTRFWEDSWLFDRPLCYLIPEPYILGEQKKVSVATVNNGGVQLSFRRWLPIEIRDIWTKIWSLVEMFQLSENPDKIMWKWDKKGANSLLSQCIFFSSGQI